MISQLHEKNFKQHSIHLPFVYVYIVKLPHRSMTFGYLYSINIIYMHVQILGRCNAFLHRIKLLLDHRRLVNHQLYVRSLTVHVYQITYVCQITICLSEHKPNVVRSQTVCQITNRMSVYKPYVRSQTKGPVTNHMSDHQPYVSSLIVCQISNRFLDHQQY